VRSASRCRGSCRSGFAPPPRRPAGRHGRRGTWSPMHHQVGAMLERPLQRRRGEGIVEDGQRPRPPGDRATAAMSMTRRLGWPGSRNRGFGSAATTPPGAAARRGEIDRPHVMPTWSGRREQGVGAAIERVVDHHLVARLQQVTGSTRSPPCPKPRPAPLAASRLARRCSSSACVGFRVRRRCRRAARRGTAPRHPRLSRTRRSRS